MTQTINRNDRDREHEVHGLRLALGSILSPKRAPSSRASSGTASPAHFGGLAHAHTYPHAHTHGHNNTPHEPSHLHTPLDEHGNPVAAPAMMTETSSTASGMRPPTVTRSQSASSVHSSDGPEDSPGLSDSDPASPPIMTTTNLHTNMSPEEIAKAKKLRKEGTAGAAKDGKVQEGGIGGFVATLQSKRAWDALIHGNMS